MLILSKLKLLRLKNKVGIAMFGLEMEMVHTQLEQISIKYTIALPPGQIGPSMIQLPQLGQLPLMTRQVALISSKGTSQLPMTTQMTRHMVLLTDFT